MQIKKWMNENKDNLPTYLFLFIIFTLYIAGIITQATQVSIFADEATKISFNPLYCIMVNFTVSTSGLVFICVVYGIAVALAITKDKSSPQETEKDERGFNIEKSGVYGTSKLMNETEARDFCEIEPLDRTTGLILGMLDGNKDKIISISPDSKRIKKDAFGNPIVKEVTDEGKTIYERENLVTNGNRHCVVTGASGSGKSYCYARPAIFQSIRQGESLVITDPKGELFRDTSEYAKSHGYTVKILNLMSPENSDSWDALAEMKASTQIGIETQTFISIIIANTSDPNGGDDKAHADGAQNLLTALALYVLTAQGYNGPQTLGAVYDLLQKTDEELDAMFAMLPENSLASRPWKIFRKASEKLGGNFVSSAGTRLQILQDDVIKQVIGSPDIDLTLPGRSKCAYYICIPDMNTTFRFISSLFFSCMFNKLVEYSRKQPSGRLDVPVNVIMDEFIAIGKMPDFDVKLATVRSAGINISMIFQTLAQLQNAYPNGLWETLLANCYSYVCLSCNDLTTAEYISTRSGIMTTSIESHTMPGKPLFDILPQSETSHSYSVGQRAVMQPADIMKLAGKKKIIISLLGADLMTAEKFPYTAMVDPSTLEEVSMYDHAPNWRVSQQNQANVAINAQPVPHEDYSYQSNNHQTQLPQTDSPEPSEPSAKAEPEQVSSEKLTSNTQTNTKLDKAHQTDTVPNPKPAPASTEPDEDDDGIPGSDDDFDEAPPKQEEKEASSPPKPKDNAATSKSRKKTSKQPMPSLIKDPGGNINSF